MTENVAFIAEITNAFEDMQKREQYPFSLKGSFTQHLKTLPEPIKLHVTIQPLGSDVLVSAVQHESPSQMSVTTTCWLLFTLTVSVVL